MGRYSLPSSSTPEVGRYGLVEFASPSFPAPEQAPQSTVAVAPSGSFVDTLIGLGKSAFQSVKSGVEDILAKSGPVQLAAGQNPFSDSSSQNLSKQVQVSTEQNQVYKKFLSEGKAPEEAMRLAKSSLTATQRRGIEDVVIGSIGAPEAEFGKVAKEATKDLAPEVAGNIRLSKFNLPQEAKKELAAVINENDSFVTQRRGVQSFADTEVLAKEISQPGRTLKAGSSLNAEELQSLGDHITYVRTQLDETSKKIAQGTNNDLDIAKQAELQLKMGSLLASYSGATAEAGRSLSILRNLRDAVASKDVQLIREAVKALGGRDQIEEVARRLAAFPEDDLVGKYRFIRSLQRPGAADYASWYWYTNLLSGPKTHVRNILGNLSNLTFNTVSKPFAAGADVVRSKLSGTPREVFLGELPHEVAGMASGIKTGFNKALYVLQHGFSMDDVVKTDFRPPEVPGGLATNFIGRSLDAADTFFRSIASQAELYSQAYSRAQKGALKGEAAQKFIEDFIANPPVSAMKEVAKAGSQAVFRGEPGPLASAVARLKNDFSLSLPGGRSVKVFNPVKFVLPFVSTPAQIIKSSLEASPVGLFTGFFKSTAREQSQAFGKAAFGTLALAPLALMAAEGNISGSGPTDRELKDLLYRQGWQPNSIRIGDKWYSYSNFQPLALPLSLIANAYESWHYDGKEVNAGEIAAKVGNSLLQSSYLSGIASLQDALSDPSRFGKAFASKFLQSLVPLSSLQRQVAQAGDETVRQPETVTEAIKTGTPGLSTEVRPRLDVLGQESTRDTGLPQPVEFLTRLFSPVEVRQIRETPVEKELVRLQDQVQVGFPAKAFTIGKKKVELSPDEYNALLKDSGSRLKGFLERAVASDSWAKRDDAGKVLYIKKAVELAREEAKKVLVKGSDRIKALLRK